MPSPGLLTCAFSTGAALCEQSHQLVRNEANTRGALPGARQERRRRTGRPSVNRLKDARFGRTKGIDTTPDSPNDLCTPSVARTVCGSLGFAGCETRKIKCFAANDADRCLLRWLFSLFLCTCLIRVTFVRGGLHPNFIELAST